MLFLKNNVEDKKTSHNLNAPFPKKSKLANPCFMNKFMDEVKLYFKIEIKNNHTKIYQISTVLEGRIMD